jgi:phage replication-related protein YjqB (UPF0714/DUF867 family)
MSDLYHDPSNVEGTTYGKRWKRHEWGQTVEEQPTDNAETQAIVMAIHGGGIEKGTSEIALATAGYHPATLIPIVDGHALHDFWLFEGLLSSGNGRLHVDLRDGVGEEFAAVHQLARLHRYAGCWENSYWRARP